MPICVYGKSKTDVKNKLFALRREPSRRADPERLTVAEWLTRWLQSVKDDPSLSLSTYRLYKNTVERHLVPYIGLIRLSGLRAAHVWDLLDALARNGVGDRTKQLAHKVLHRALQIAHKRDKVQQNVCSLVDRPSATSKPRAFLETEEEILRFLHAAEGTRYHALYVTALYTGMRQGELLALTWDCVDLSQGYIDVRATLTKDDSGNLVPTRPKTTASIRRIILPKVALDVLRAPWLLTIRAVLESPWR
ncbi:MAG: site-specific integrase [Candidatus Eremiobacteraeota bacterium]|nr:site-specific integrase [Candidatus Eremiobacteraeota bacterium]MBC5827572.1 site-specific integrase [Candidatus Eremiobacteraeota bacterium]